MFYAAGPLEAGWTTNALGFSTNPDQARMAGWGTFNDVIKTLEGAVGDRQYLVGDSFTAADVYVGAQLGWGLRFGSFNSPVFKRYVAALEERPAFKRATELDGPMPQRS
jgi:glutathione S-transferase